MGVQCRFLDINGNSSQGRFPKYGKILEKKKQSREIGRKSKRTKSKSSEKDGKQQVSYLKLELNTVNNRNKTDNVLENMNTEQRERKIYSRLIYIYELSSITKEIIKQGESLF